MVVVSGQDGWSNMKKYIVEMTGRRDMRKGEKKGETMPPDSKPVYISFKSFHHMYFIILSIMYVV